MDICDEQGGINFQLIRCLEEADRLCEEIVLNPWELEGIDEYYHKMERRLDSCQISLSCAFATVCVTLNCMTNLPEPVYQLAHDLRGLIIGEGNNLYNNLQQRACRKDIRMSGFMYGDIPPIPKEVLELAELKDSNAQLTKEVIYYKRKIHTMEEEKKVKNIGFNVEQMTINMSGGTLVQHADLVQASGDVRVEDSENVEEISAESILGIPSERDYKAVRIYIEERSRFDPDFKTFCEANSRVAICQRLSKEFGWMVDPYGLGRNINRKRKKKV